MVGKQIPWSENLIYVTNLYYFTVPSFSCGDITITLFQYNVAASQGLWRTKYCRHSNVRLYLIYSPKDFFFYVLSYLFNLMSACIIQHEEVLSYLFTLMNTFKIKIFI